MSRAKKICGSLAVASTAPTAWRVARFFSALENLARADFSIFGSMAMDLFVSMEAKTGPEAASWMLTPCPGVSMRRFPAGTFRAGGGGGAGTRGAAAGAATWAADAAGAREAEVSRVSGAVRTDQEEEPISTASPVLSGVEPWSWVPFTKVPFLLLRSVRWACPSRSSRRAW